MEAIALYLDLGTVVLGYGGSRDGQVLVYELDARGVTGVFDVARVPTQVGEQEAPIRRVAPGRWLAVDRRVAQLSAGSSWIWRAARMPDSRAPWIHAW